MIRVKPPPEPDELRVGAAAEVAENAAHAPNGPFKFEVYKIPAVKQALNEAFGFKCAYCESNTARESVLCTLDMKLLRALVRAFSISQSAIGPFLSFSISVSMAP